MKMAIDKRLDLQTFKGQRIAVQDLFIKFLGAEIDNETVRGATTLIREARMILQAELTTTPKENPAMKKKVTDSITPNGPFPRLIKPL
jgi:hypothetical protein|tara:strand:+ start:774 stop:1037 length:264 start_codon:yes stop_codon:yes gene_type:complete